MTTAIKHDQLKILAANGGVKSITIVGRADSFGLNVQTLSGEKLLMAKSGQPRSFKRMETLLDYVKSELGIVKASLQFEHWSPKQGALPLKH